MVGDPYKWPLVTYWLLASGNWRLAAYQVSGFGCQVSEISQQITENRAQMTIMLFHTPVFTIGLLSSDI